MNNLKRSLTLKSACVPIVLAATSIASAQNSGGTGKGLDQLDEQQVMANLASDNLSTLLQRDFDAYKIPAGERDQVLTLIKLKQLANPVGLNTAGRRALAVTVAKGFDGLISKATDADVLMEQTNLLYSNGIVPTVTELEYFGENPTAQEQLHPVAETAKRLYEQVVVLAGKKADALAAGIKTTSDLDRIKPQLDKMRTDKFFGEYSDNMASYALCISLPKKDPKRKEAADGTIAYLKQFDDPKSGVQATVRLQTGKLQLVEGSYADAKATFASLISGTDISPLPDISQQNDARYFTIVADISARKLNDAEGEIPMLENWQAQSYLPKLNPGDQAAVKAAMSMLKFRLYSAQSDLTFDVDEKKKTNDAAISVLADLLKSQPNLKDLVFDQLIGRIPAQPDFSTLNPLILQALQQQGFEEVVKKPDEPVDKAKLTRAVSAARELVSRKGQPGVDDTSASLSAYFIAYALDRLQQDKEAAAAFLDFAEKFPNDKTKASDAMDHATALIGKLRKATRASGENDPDTLALYDRFLPIAINLPYNRKQFAFQYAALLQGEHKFKNSVEYFKQVPKTEKLYPESRYLQMLALSAELADTTLAADDRKEIVSQILSLTQEIDGLLAGAKNDTEKQKYAAWTINADLIAADLTRRELKDPAKSLQILTGFEGRVASAKEAEKAHNDVLQLRINDYMDLGQLDQATKTLVDLLSVNEVQGQGLMFDVLKTVGHDMDTARAEGKTDELNKLAQDQAQLSGFVVSWASKSNDPKVQAQLKQFQLFDADAKREAADLLTDPDAKKKGLQNALAAYQAVNDKEPDEQISQLGIGLVQYSLGNYEQSAKYLGPLVRDKHVGEPTQEVKVGNTSQIVENPQFWEANYKLVRSLVELARKNPQDPKSKENLNAADQYVGSLYVIYGAKTGGKAYHEDFEKLKTDLATLLPSKSGAGPATPPIAKK